MALIKHRGFNLEQLKEYNGKFVLSNGFIGVGQIMEELTLDDDAHIKINGLVDQCKGTNRLVSVFNPMHLEIFANNQLLHPKKSILKDHKMSLDLESGLFFRETIYTIDNIDITVSSEKFVDQKTLSLVASRYTFSAKHNIAIELYHGFENNEIYFDCFSDIDFPEFESGFALSSKQNKSLKPLYIYSDFHKSFRRQNLSKKRSHHEHYSLYLIADEQYTLTKFSAFSVTKSQNLDKLIKVVDKAKNIGFDQLLEDNKVTWKKLWKDSSVDVVNNDIVNNQTKLNIFHLLSHRPFNSQVCLPRFGLTNEEYVNDRFNEAFSFRFFLNTDHKIAKRMIMNRVHRLDDAIRFAKKQGYKGALYAGDIYLNALIVYSLERYIEQTDDFSVLPSGGVEMVLEISRYFLGILKPDEKNKVFETFQVKDFINDRIIDNSLLLNYLIKDCFIKTLSLISLAKQKFHSEMQVFLDSKDYNFLILDIKEARKKIIVARPNEDNLLENHKGFFSEDKTSGFVDVFMLFFLYPDEFKLIVKKANYNYYKDIANNDVFTMIINSIAKANLEHDKDSFKVFRQYFDLNSIGDKFSKTEILDLGLSGGLYCYLVYGLSFLKHKKYLLLADSLIPTDIRRLEYTVKVGNNKADIKLKRNSAEVRWVRK